MGGVPFLPSTSIRLGRLPNALPVLTCLETLNIDVDRVWAYKRLSQSSISIRFLWDDPTETLVSLTHARL